ASTDNMVGGVDTIWSLLGCCTARPAAGINILCENAATGRIRVFFFFFFSSRRRHTRLQGDWSSDVCSSDLPREKIISIIVVVASCHIGVIALQIFMSSLTAADCNAILNEHTSTRAHAHFWPKSVRSEERRVGKECRARWWMYE